ncbi:PilZ domain-containing protein [Candidatus Magnetominusculus xianensis]|uniref:PilZ domain-containing protein n=1 Tax=Candidatus Magnetominusculus xianensis TaxID=1748249 RepID=A0ABR5SDJ3_9BACT|nr:PilZ domain-containing protein [Candidatus Magnetominusculus xianensis]KWT78151.1 hypothetical protein ASN18_2965 [Candidatus Magnetominusculus xianensis]MBF0404711.1 PilZ domain-containing protein [Nitrospirota bacterium]
MKSDIDDRTYDRKAYNNTVEFRTLDDACLTQKTAASFNIGSGGIGLVLDQLLVKGKVVQLFIHVRDGVTVPVYAEIVWSKSCEGGYEAGLRFFT